jgi:hypothetical protein
MSMLPSLITTESDQLVMNGIKPVEAVFVAEIPGYQEILDKLTGTDDVSNRLKQRLCEQLGCDTINIRLNPHSKLMASIWNKQGILKLSRYHSITH